MSLGLIPFLAGLVSLVGYSVFRFYEARRRERFFESSRKKLDSFSIELYRLAVFGELPAVYRVSLRNALHVVTHASVNRAVKLLRAVERPLSRLSYRLRITRMKDVEHRDPSPFLKNITGTKEKNGETAPDSIESH